MYDVDAKKAERTKDRSIRVAGEVYPRRPWTVALDQSVEPIRQVMAEMGEEWSKASFVAAQLAEDGGSLPDDKRYSKAKVKAAEDRMRELDIAVIDKRMEMIVALVGPSETGSGLTLDALRENLEIEDLDPILKMLQDGEKTVGGPDPTGAPLSV